MDIGFETIIYIVLGLVFVLAQVAKQKKKAAMTQTADSEDVEVDEQKPPTSLLEEFLGMQEKKPVVQEPVEINQQPSEVLSPSSIQPGPGVSKTTSVNDYSGTPMRRRNAKSTENQSTKRSGKSGFDLRTAIIYEAVLERKYF